jgi:hypothetical protein
MKTIILCVLFGFLAIVQGSNDVNITNTNLSLRVFQDHTKPRFEFHTTAKSSHHCAIRLEGVDECVGDTHKCNPVGENRFHMGSLNWTFSAVSNGTNSLNLTLTTDPSTIFDLLRIRLGIEKIGNDTGSIDTSITLTNYTWASTSSKAKLRLSFSKLGDCRKAFFTGSTTAHWCNDDGEGDVNVNLVSRAEQSRLFLLVSKFPEGVVLTHQNTFGIPHLVSPPV